MTSDVKVPKPEPSVVGAYDTEWTDYQLERKGKIDIRFSGCKIGEGEYESLDGTRSTEVCIYITKGGNFVYEVVQTHRQGERKVELSFVDVFGSAEQLREFIMDPDGKRYGQATSAAWVEACDALGLDVGAFAEVIV